eukprot:TRINITY_DN22096_c1_g3_i1.p1 TRINITY_DN22096_c1_g3~~TRINITY_DN22096_c1_g3_i1.p1  ORF type:complete len:453 (-),score=73.45 TRINITY_DN22096_c1_g3_i1:371-1729(-)
MVSSTERSRSRSQRKPPEKGISVNVEAFLRSEPEVEERAAMMLRSKPAAVQQLVIQRGGLAGTRNPTAVLVSRIRNAEEGLRPVLDSEKASEVVERFLVIERVEPHAAARLRRSSKIVQEAVVARGSLSGTRDPTAVLMTRIRDAERDAPPTPQTSAQDSTVASQVPGVQTPEEYALAYYQYLQHYQAYQEALIQQQSQTPADGASQPEEADPQVVAAYVAHAAQAQATAGYLQAAGYAQYGFPQYAAHPQLGLAFHPAPPTVGVAVQPLPASYLALPGPAASFPPLPQVASPSQSDGQQQAAVVTSTPAPPAPPLQHPPQAVGYRPVGSCGVPAGHLAGVHGGWSPYCGCPPPPGKPEATSVALAPAQPRAPQMVGGFSLPGAVAGYTHMPPSMNPMQVPGGLLGSFHHIPPATPGYPPPMGATAYGYLPMGGFPPVAPGSIPPPPAVESN